MKDHQISQEVLERFASRTATSDERKAVVRHLLVGCGQCQAHLRRFWPASDPRQCPEIVDDRYDEAFERAAVRALAAMNVAPTTAHGTRQLLSELDEHPHQRQETLVRNHPRYWNVELCDVLITRSHDARFSDIVLMRNQSRLALLIANMLDAGSAHGETRLADCRARAWAAFGNALRVSGDLPGADQAFTTAHAHFAAGSGSEGLKARFLSQLASLRFDQRRFEDSLALIKQVVKIWRRLHNPRELTRALVQQAMATGEGGRPRSAVSLLMEACKLVDSAAEPKLALIILHNIIKFHAYGGDPDTAQRLYVEARQLYEQEADSLIRVKALWLEGQIMSAQGHLESAVPLLSAARDGFLAEGNRYEAGMVSLDLAAVFAKLGRLIEMRALAGETLQEMEIQGVRREALAALILLMQAANAEGALLLIRRAATAIKAPHRGG